MTNLLFCCDKRRQQTDHVSKSSRGDDEQAHLVTSCNYSHCLLVRGSLCGPVGNKLNRTHSAESTNVPNQRVLFFPPCGNFSKDTTKRFRALREVSYVKRLPRSEGSRTGDRIASECATQRPWRGCIHNLGATCNRSQWHSSG